MAILEELDRGERSLLLRALQEIGKSPLGHVGMVHYEGESKPDAFQFVTLLINRGFLRENMSVPFYDTEARRNATRMFYSLTSEGMRVANELQKTLVSGAPSTLVEYRKWAGRLFERVLNSAPAGTDCRPALEAAKNQLNALPTAFVIVSETKESDETWTWDAVLRTDRRH